MQDPLSIASRIVEVIEKSPQKRVTGSELALFLKFTFPGFSPGAYSCLNLRAFVQRFVSGIGQIDRSGGDIVYGLRSQISDQSDKAGTVSPAITATQPEVGTSAPVDRRIWKTFASPNSFWKLFGHPETGQLTVISPGKPGLPSPWVMISPCPPETHLQIAKDFVAGLLDENQRNVLSQTLSQLRWWDYIFSAAERLGIATNWQVFRRRRLQGEFFRSLQRLGIPLKSSTVASSRAAEGERDAESKVSSSAISAEQRLRRLAIGAVERMSISELRSLNLPLGHVLDELERDS